MKKENFRGISKDNVMQLVSILDKVDPEVAKALIAQIRLTVSSSCANSFFHSEIIPSGSYQIQRDYI